MKQVILYSLLLFMLVLTACPVKMDNPIDEGSYDVPSWLPGKWTANSKETYRFEKGAKKTQFKCTELDSAGNVKGVYDPVIMSKVGNNIFISAAGTDGYYLFEFIKIDDKNIELKEIAEEILEDYEITESATSSALKSFIEKNKGNDDIYAVSTRYRKI